MARVSWCFQRRSRYRCSNVSEKPPIVYEFCRPGACNKVSSRSLPHWFRSAPKLPVTGEKQQFHMLSFRNHCCPEFVLSLTIIRLGTGRGFRYPCSEQLPMASAPFGAGPHTREDAFVEASSTPRLAVSAIGEMEWAI